MDQLSIQEANHLMLSKVVIQIVFMVLIIQLWMKLKVF